MTELENAMRDMLHERSRDVATSPDWLRDFGLEPQDGIVLDIRSPRGIDESRPSRRLPPNRWPLLAAAAALVVGAVGLLAAMLPALRPDTPAAPVLERLACRTTAPQAWSGPVAAATVAPRGLDGALLLAVAPGGGAIFGASDRAKSNASVADVRFSYLPPHSSRPRELALVPSPRRTSTDVPSMTASVVGNEAVLSVLDLAVPPYAGEIITVDLVSGRRTVVARTGQDGNEVVLSPGYVIGRRIFWQTGSPHIQDRRTIWVRGLDGGVARRFAQSQAVQLSGGAAGLSWSLDGRIDQLAALPAAVADNGSLDATSLSSYVTDGQAWAWPDDGALAWYSPQFGRVVRFPQVKVRTDSAGAEPILAVAGPLIAVYWQHGREGDLFLLDVRTGTAVPQSVHLGLQGRDGVMVGDPLESAGGSEPTGVMRLDVDSLAPGHCRP